MKWRRRSEIWPAILLGILLLTGPRLAAARTFYVDADALGANNGSSWANAYKSLQSALAAAGSGDEIWVAAGAYKPGSSRTSSFQLKTGVGVYGGFAGSETSLGERDFEANETILTGDLNSNGRDNADAFHVVYASGVGGTAVIDGFTITGGNANGDWPDDSGGGMHNLDSSPTVTNCTFSNNTADYSGGGMYNRDYSNPTITNCTFSNNRAVLALQGGRGGGLYNRKSSPTVTDCNFSGNSAEDSGGGMYNRDSSPTVTDCTFSSNSATYGGGMQNLANSNPVVAKCLFSNNSAGWFGGGMYNHTNSSPTVTDCDFTGNSTSHHQGCGGGMYNYLNSSPTVTNCLFSNNSVGWYDGRGGGMSNWDYSSPTVKNCTFTANTAIHGGGMANCRAGCSPTVTNCTFTANMASDGSGMYSWANSTPTVTNCILWGNWPGTSKQISDIESAITVTYSDVQGGTGQSWFGEGCIDLPPLFINPAAGDLRPSWVSPCLDAGVNSAPGLPEKDLAGNPRVVDGDEDGVPVVDMGVYEHELKKPGAALQVSISPEDAVAAGARWQLDGDGPWLDSGEQIHLAPGYHEVAFNYVEGWLEPQAFSVRAIGDVCTPAIAEYQPLPVFEIGRIPPRDAPHGRELKFYVDANWLANPQFTMTIDEEPEGGVSLDSVSGLFTYEPNDAHDNTSFDVTFTAASGADVNKQTVAVRPLPDLPPENTVVSRPSQLFPDPCDRDYLFVNEVLSDANEYLNGQERQARSVTVAGKKIVVENVDGNPVYVYDGSIDINEMTICAETLVIRDPLRLAQTNVTIYAGELSFEGDVADINTTPIDYRSIPSGQKADGLPGGNLRLYVESYNPGSGHQSRFMMSGTKGHNGGRPGHEGSLICTLDTTQPLAWLTPYTVKMVLAHAKDAYLYGYVNQARDILTEYEGLLGAYAALSEWNGLPEQWRFEFEQMHQEIITLLHRIENGFDYFGNPPNWVPMLSFEALKTAYEQQIRHAIRVVYLSYWLQNKAGTIQEKVDALKNGREGLWEQTEEFRSDYNDLVASGIIVRLKDQAADLTRRIGDENSGLVWQLKHKEAELIESATTNVRWRKALKGLATIATSSLSTLWGPRKALEGGASAIWWGAGLAHGAITAVSDTFLAQDNPWSKVAARTDVAGRFNRIDFETATDRWLGGCNDIDLGDIESNGADGYLQNLRSYSTSIAGGMYDVRETLMTTSLNNKEVEAELMNIKAEDPAFSKLVDQVTELMATKEVFNRHLAAAMQKVSTLSAGITNNLLAIDAMNRDESHANRILDPRAIMYVRDMEKRALERLRMYHYYMAKAYEYRLLEPYPGDLNVQSMFNKMQQIVSADGRLGLADYDALKVIYEEQLQVVTDSILEKYRYDQEKSIRGSTSLSPQEIDKVNDGQVVTINLFERGMFEAQRENIRIVDMNVLEIELEPNPGDICPDAYLTVKMKHSGLSYLQLKGQTYTFQHPEQNVAWMSDCYVDGGIYHDNTSKASDSLLSVLLDGPDPDKIMFYSRPAAWADINLSRSLTQLYPCSDIRVKSLRLRVKYDFYQRDENLLTLRVSTEPNGPSGLAAFGLQPYFVIDKPDENGRGDGEGRFRRVYDCEKGGTVLVTAPENYGCWRFDRWTSESGQTITEVPKLTVNVNCQAPRQQSVRAWYDYEGPPLSPADFDESAYVDFSDFDALTRAWHTIPTHPQWDPKYDISETPDNVIDMLDFAAFADNWLATPQ